NGYTGADGSLPFRSADRLTYICPAPYTEVWLTYVPPSIASTQCGSWCTRRTTEFVCEAASGYYWSSPAGKPSG
ncbi:hypothetical protein PENTCL1PPCAC_21025, partial [Pristionchus entomophagus]